MNSQNINTEANKKSFVTLLLVVIVLIVLFSLYFVSKEKKLSFLQGKKSKPVSKQIEVTSPPQVDISKEIEKAAGDVGAQKSYQDIKDENQGIVTSPNIQNKELKNTVRNTQSNSGTTRKSKINIVFYNGSEFEPPLISVKRGDVVTWRNNSSNDMEIVGDGWGTLMPVKEKKTFSQTFDIKGRYLYGDSKGGAKKNIIVVE